jgi:RND family efflux transporter MFP subunit
MKKRFIYIGLGLVVVAVIVGSRIAASRPQKIEYDTYDVARQSLKQTVQVTGEVASTQDVDLKFETSGRLKAISKNVGDLVKANEVVAILDDRSQSVDVQKAQAALLSAQASLSRVLNGSTPEQLRIDEVNAENAETSLERARQSLTDTQASGSASLAKAYGDLGGQLESLFLRSSSAMQTLKSDIFESIGSMRSDISSPDASTQAQALSAFGAAGSALGSMDADIVSYRNSATPAESDRLADAIIAAGQKIRNAAALANAVMQGSAPIGGTSEAAFDARKNEVKSAWNDMNGSVNAAVSQKLVVASTSASNIGTLNASQQAVKSAEGALESAKASLALKKAAATTADISSARAGVASSQAALGSAQLAYEKTRIRAPFAGTIAQIPGRAGSTVSPADVVVKLHGDGIYEIVADVPETAVAKLSTGMKAVITLDAYGENVKFEGQLTSIDTAQTVIQDVIYYKTRFMLVSQEKSIRAGMTANVTVVAQEHADVLVVPQRAIRVNGNKTVRVLENDQPVSKTVETGLFGDEGLVEITSGLSGGEKVILAARQGGKIIKE